METDLLKFVIEGLQSRKGEWPQIAADTGVPYSTLAKIAREETPDPGVKTVQRLADHLRALQSQGAAA